MALVDMACFRWLLCMAAALVKDVAPAGILSAPAMRCTAASTVRVASLVPGQWYRVEIACCTAHAPAAARRSQILSSPCRTDCHNTPARQHLNACRLTAHVCFHCRNLTRPTVVKEAAKQPTVNSVNAGVPDRTHMLRVLKFSPLTGT